MSEKYTANSEQTFADLLDRITELWHEYHYLRVSIVPGADRSIPQNDMFFELYTHIADWFYGGDVELARAECKLDIGLDILRRDDPTLNEVCAESIDRLPREKQLKFIKTMSVTSEMSMGQARECITRIMDTYSEHGLLWPSYLIKKRPKFRRVIQAAGD